MSKQQGSIMSLWPKGVLGHAIDDDGNLMYIILGENERPLAVGTLSEFIPPGKKHILRIAEVSNMNAVKKHYENDTDAQFIDDIRDFFSSMVAVPSDKFLDLMVCFLISTCFIDQCTHSPILWLFSEPGTGKTRFGHLLAYTSLIGVQVAGVNEAHVIRFSDDYGALIFFDCTDLTSEMKSKKTVDVMLHRFESGVKYMKVKDIKAGPYLDNTVYNLFGPTVIATNFSLPEALITRCIRIEMQNSDKLFEMPPSPENCLPFKERLLALKLRHAGRQLPVVAKPYPSRLGDITRPLLATCRMVGMDESWISELIDGQLKNRKGVHKIDDLLVAQAFLDAAKKSPSLKLITSQSVYSEYCRLDPLASLTDIQVGMKLTKMEVESVQKDKGRGRCTTVDLLEKFSKRYGIEFEPSDYEGMLKI